MNEHLGDYERRNLERRIETLELQGSRHSSDLALVKVEQTHLRQLMDEKFATVAETHRVIEVQIGNVRALVEKLTGVVEGLAKLAERGEGVFWVVKAAGVVGIITAVVALFKMLVK